MKCLLKKGGKTAIVQVTLDVGSMNLGNKIWLGEYLFRFFFFSLLSNDRFVRLDVR